MSQETRTQLNDIERTLNSFGMTLSEYTKTLELKGIRNAEFYKNGKPTLLEAKENLYSTTLSDEIKSCKETCYSFGNFVHQMNQVPCDLFFSEKFVIKYYVFLFTFFMNSL